jgi:hypothetical protein
MFTSGVLQYSKFTRTHYFKIHELIFLVQRKVVFSLLKEKRVYCTKFPYWIKFTINRYELQREEVIIMDNIQTVDKEQTQKPPVLLYWREKKLKPEQPEEKNQTSEEEKQSN